MTKYNIVVECCNCNGEQFVNEYEPKSQNWNDIIACYEEQKRAVYDEIGDANMFENEEEWTLNDIQPIARIDLIDGYGWYEIYVCKLEK